MSCDPVPVQRQDTSCRNGLKVVCGNRPLASSGFMSVWPEQWRCQQAWAKPHRAVICRSKHASENPRSDGTHTHTHTYIYMFYIYVLYLYNIYIYIYIYIASKTVRSGNWSPQYCSGCSDSGRRRCTGLRPEDHSHCKLLDCDTMARTRLRLRTPGSDFTMNSETWPVQNRTNTVHRRGRNCVAGA